MVRATWLWSHTESLAVYLVLTTSYCTLPLSHHSPNLSPPSTPSPRRMFYPCGTRIQEGGHTDDAISCKLTAPEVWTATWQGLRMQHWGVVTDRKNILVGGCRLSSQTICLEGPPPQSVPPVPPGSVWLHVCGPTWPSVSASGGRHGSR